MLTATTHIATIQAQIDTVQSELGGNDQAMITDEVYGTKISILDDRINVFYAAQNIISDSYLDACLRLGVIVATHTMIENTPIPLQPDRFINCHLH